MLRFLSITAERLSAERGNRTYVLPPTNQCPWTDKPMFISQRTYVPNENSRMQGSLGADATSHFLQNPSSEFNNWRSELLNIPQPPVSHRTYSALTGMMKVARVYSEREMFAMLSQTLSWSHFLELITIKDPTKRLFYQQMGIAEHWSVQRLRDNYYCCHRL